MSIRNIAFMFIALLLGTTFVFQNKNTEPATPIDSAEQAEESIVKVTRVIDGDTLTVNIDGKEERVRLLGVDAAEIDYKDDVRETKRECYSLEARDELERLTLGKGVTLKSDVVNENRDKFGRLLRYVYLPDGSLVNNILIQTGFTRFLSFFPISLDKQFEESEKLAEQNSLGLWSVCL